jgi:hypothetical protein
MTVLARPTAIINSRPVLSSKKSPSINKPETDSNKRCGFGAPDGVMKPKLTVVVI